MGTILSYMVEVAIIMTFLYVGYKCMLASSTFHRLNRVVIIAIYAVSWVLPALMPAMRPLFSGGAPIAVDGGGHAHITLPLPEDVPAHMASGTIWADIAMWAYMLGAAGVLLFTVAGAVRLVRLLHNGELMDIDGAATVVSDAAPGPFSWGGFVVIRPDDMDSDLHFVMAHERAHMRLGHWIDLVLAQVTLVAQWFSPAAWLLMRELRKVHEFQADEAAMTEGAADYQMMLLKKTVGSSFPTFANSLNHSLTKTRITMMLSKKTRPARMAAVFGLPVMAALAVTALSQPAVAGLLGVLSEADAAAVFDRKVSDSSADVQMPVAAEVDSDSDSPVAAESETAVPAQTASEAEKGEKEPQAKGNEKISNFTIFVDGELYKGELNSFNTDDIASMTVVKNDPAYPGGKIMVVTKKGAASGVKSEVAAGSDAVHLKVDRCAEFEGGQAGLMEFLKQNIKYPAGVEASDKPERVIVQFTIGVDGSVSDARIVRGSDNDAFNTEALRVINASSGKWHPGVNEGKEVTSQFTIPIMFKK